MCEYIGKEPSDREIDWRQYNLFIDLYKFYFDVVIKANIAFYAITGAIISFNYSILIKYKMSAAGKEHPEIYQSMGNGLFLPIFTALVFVVVFIYGAIKLYKLHKEVIRLAKKLCLGYYPDFTPLVSILCVFAVFHIIAAILLYYLWKITEL